ncbi:hypothetical protein A5637_18610 [Mycolicibacterium fortuitum]|uniref:hypothetical protein n=1 Tax=Mycolicibacterium fortuitum TaxID=1766 RepID=UPI0007EDA6B4|nr:hypothetical protein [Mycolicibacterium fortuitum]OBK01710.1 hypothetical protein A5637_18610 [Mycolicibacterium fortuitum]
MTAAYANPVNHTEFWEQRESLRRIRDFSRMCMVGPWALLGGVMIRAIADVSPHVTIPAMVGGEASLNLFVGFVGRSGNGKGTSDSASRRYWPSTVGELPIGTGEGLAATFYRDPNNPDEAANAPEQAIFTASEVDTLNILGGRSGATLYPELRKLAMGETLGAQNASKDHRRIVPAHTYRACLSVGVQPERAGTLIGDTAGGTTQRFVWLPVIDPEAPDIPPTDVQPLKPAGSPWSAGPIDLPRVVWHEVRAHRKRVLRGDPDVDPLDGHRNLTRVKVAAALALIEGNDTVTEEDWHIAGDVMDMSDSTRQSVIAAIEREWHSEVASAARSNALRAALTGDEAIRLVADKILDRLASGSAAWSALRSGIAVSQREHFEAAIDLLQVAGHIEVADTSRGKAVRLRQP